jgi:hypothetical protein
MATPQTRLPESFAPEGVLAAAQRNAVCLSHAWARIAQGVMQAGLAQLDAMRAIHTGSGDLAETLPTGDPQAAALHWLDHTHTSLDTALRSYRRIGDDLLETFFSATSTLVEGLATGLPKAPMPNTAPNTTPNTTPDTTPDTPSGAAPLRPAVKTPA